MWCLFTFLFVVVLNVSSFSCVLFVDGMDFVGAVVDEIALEGLDGMVKVMFVKYCNCSVISRTHANTHDSSFCSEMC